ncbi:uncharacterized protein LOC128850370 isoform X4 [Cuculus canorus]|uniref:uncharacterized protein LOC128850370 isoform X4 n=1 Tax=Cuculus canorus TaxID=55661 RepID=UPI0023AB1972|nr:uncharacterized protein LOC128850370 isoform X4 [Cuculus canorus]
MVELQTVVLVLSHHQSISAPFPEALSLLEAALRSSPRPSLLQTAPAWPPTEGSPALGSAGLLLILSPPAWLETMDPPRQVDTSAREERVELTKLFGEEQNKPF